ncbi:SDR family oxidoreductase [Achromobacter xylosoxidans]|jgi:benzil reductase ((S)-benzoin forming)|uniref:SDR family oxidoreductase n=1 Tax=Alcaligenes xylosoxydans xylosoxydans TaxID=85698 RepID=A0A9W5A8B4_ALCXX|nr:SDR family oxidoreductase [Achromobacter xylosoxidans]MCH1996086.1 SDR family oxidoreductase [Achromobacter xylosoxidans]MCZ8401787.1 SDR family oxidoreductase [Achromobacter xylosoxidans]OFQ46663.1 short-chain dehydrogenase [Achromobacter xylosoxidans]CCH09397.1 short chain dehydrogenase [Achromobacter xylosoxidans NH44784-1996]CUI48110.1 Benzil reductase [Achromobacter xylosoxidans]
MSDTIAILTGASRGIGAAMARGLAKPGTRLITLARREDPELAAYARSQDAQLEQLSVDLSDLAAAEAAARRICDALPRDAGRYLLINNAGTVHPVSGTDALIDGPAIAAAFNLNVTAVMLLTARFLAAVADLKADRRVLNISSGAGRNPNAGWGVYCATKAALDMYSRVVKQEQGENGARVVSLAPGIVDTDMQAAIRSSDPKSFPALAKFQDFHASGKLSSPANVASRILAYLDRDDFGTTEIDDIRNYD